MGHQQKSSQRLPITYEGEYYHIANFLSLQQGKVYNPSTSRMARRMAVARTKFYERVERIINPMKTKNGLYLNDITSFWIPGIGLKCGQVLRLLRKTSVKTASPVFEWKKNISAREKFTVCFLVLSHTKLDNNR